MQGANIQELGKNIDRFLDRNEVPRNEMRDELDNFSESLRAKWMPPDYNL